jgi:hypothetical protein
MTTPKRIYLYPSEVRQYETALYGNETEYIPVDEYNELVVRFNKLQEERDKLLKAMEVMIRGRKV